MLFRSYFLGGFGRLYADEIRYQANGVTPLFDTIVPSMLATLPAIIIAVVIVLVLSASMSTLSSLVLTSSSTFTLDVITPMKKNNIKEDDQVKIMRLLIVFFIIVSAVIAVIKDSHPEITFIAQMMGVSWGALAGTAEPDLKRPALHAKGRRGAGHLDRKSTRLNSSHPTTSRMPSSA